MEQTYFLCKNCGKKVNYEAIGTKNRNHCQYCLWSLHIDYKTPGDRLSLCQGLMKPVGLAFKKDVLDKYGKKINGELMIVHKCDLCNKISKNRLAGDDDTEKILDLLIKMSQFNTLPVYELGQFKLLTEKDIKEVKEQLFGK